MANYESVTEQELWKLLDSILQDIKCDEATRRALVSEARHQLQAGTGGEPFDPVPDKLHGKGPAPGIYKEIGFNERHKYFAVRHSELSLVKQAGTTIAALITAAAGHALPVGAVAGLFALLLQFRRKRIELTWEQGVTLSTLKKAPKTGWSPEEISLQLGFKVLLDEAEIKTALESLRNVQQGDNAFVALVSEKDGKWWAVDV